jgi:hypothetical protein
MKLRTIDDVISTWTPEELEEFKDLVAECRLREKEIRENLESSLKGLREIQDHIAAEIVLASYPWQRLPQC